MAQNAITSFVTLKGNEYQLENVRSVYVGANGQCCCGCSGKHTYASKHVEASGAKRGYPVTPDEVDDATVQRVFRKVSRHLGLVDMDERGVVSFIKGTKIYILYSVD